MAVIAQSCVQAHYPELAEIGLLIAAVGEGIATRAHKRLVRGVELLRADAAVALGSLQNILTALIRVYSSFYSCHTKMITKLIILHRNLEEIVRALSPSG